MLLFLTNLYSGATTTPIKMNNISLQLSRKSFPVYSCCSNLCYCSLVLPVTELHLNGIKQYVLFYVWILSLGIVFLRFIHLLLHINSLFFLLTCSISFYKYTAMCLSIFLLSIFLDVFGLFPIGI